ncbi:TPA: hypothetical protein WHN47_002032 [Neisseria meningitidis]
MIIQNEFNLYPSNMLPERFCYPEKYVRISNDTSLIPWGLGSKIIKKPDKLLI